MISIHSNGSRWNGQAPASIDELIKVLATEPLDAKFENYTNFINKPLRAMASHDHLNADGTPVYKAGDLMYPDAPGALNFFGNFLNVSHVFNIDTDEPELINRLTKAIRENQATPAYLAQKNQ